MFKIIILLKRKPDVSAKAFREWWLERHRPMAARLPGLRGMTINIAAMDADYDGASELWFDSEADFIAAYQTDIGQAVATDSLSMVSRRDRIAVEEIEAFPRA